MSDSRDGSDAAVRLHAHERLEAIKRHRLRALRLELAVGGPVAQLEPFEYVPVAVQGPSLEEQLDSLRALARSRLTLRAPAVDPW